MLELSCRGTWSVRFLCNYFRCAYIKALSLRQLCWPLAAGVLLSSASVLKTPSIKGMALGDGQIGSIRFLISTMSLDRGLHTPLAQEERQLEIFQTWVLFEKRPAKSWPSKARFEFWPNLFRFFVLLRTTSNRDMN